MQTVTIFINEENSDQYKKEVLNWLQSDYEDYEEESLVFLRSNLENLDYEKMGLQGSFWHNRDIIAIAFEEQKAIIAVNHNQVVGFMTWERPLDSLAEIVIIEVKKTYRRQGICTQMISAFIAQHPDIAVLLARAIPEAESFFDRLGWIRIAVDDFTDQQRSLLCHNSGAMAQYYKIIKPGVPTLSELPDGDAIAVFSQIDVFNEEEKSESSSTGLPRVNYYTVMQNPEKYHKKYFQIDVGEENRLRKPVITPFHYEGYIGIYHDKKLIVEGNVSYILEAYYCPIFGMLVIDKFNLIDPKPSVTVSLFSHESSKRKRPEEDDKKSNVLRRSVTPD